MTDAQRLLAKGSLKSAISSATGMILSLNIIDPDHFSFQNFGGWKHLLAAVGIAIVVAEARFWQQWAHSGVESTGGTNEVKP